MKIINISGENGISTLDTFSIKRIINPLYRMTTSKVEDSSTGPAYYIDDAGEIVTVAAESPLYFDGKFWNVGSFRQMCSYPYNPSMLTRNFITVSTDNNKVGDFTEYILTDQGGLWNGLKIYTSVISGNPSNKQCVTILYNIGSSNSAWIICKDSLLSDSRIVFNGTSWAVTVKGSGEISDVINFTHKAGFSVIQFYITWINPSNALYISFGPGSINNSNIKMYGASVTEIGYIWPLIGPGLTTVASRAGTSVVPITARLEDILDGTRNCKFVIDLLPKFSHFDFPVSHTESILYSGTIDFLTLSTDASGNGYINLSDGTNTASVAYDWAYDEGITIELPLGYNVAEADDKMQLIVNGTASVLTDFDGSLDPDAQMTIGRNNDYLFGVDVKILNLKQSDWI